MLNRASLLRPIAALLLVLGTASAANAQAPTVLAEVFRNMDCATCGAPTTSFEGFVATKPDVVLITYNIGAPNSSDPFYAASRASADARNSYYGGTDGLSGPTAYVDGIFAGSGPQIESQWEAYVNAASSKPLNVQLPVVHRGPNGIDTISFTLAPHKVVVPSVAIVESHVYYVNSNGAYGRPAGDLWNNVLRATLPGPSGGEAFSGMKNFDVVFDPSQYGFSGDQQNMSAILFTQDVAAASPAGNNSHQVEALGVVSLATTNGVEAKNTTKDRLMISGSGVGAAGRFALSLQSAGDVSLELYDLLGREIRTLVSGPIPAGQTTIEMNGTRIPSGVYIARLTVNGRTVDQQKFVSE